MTESTLISPGKKIIRGPGAMASMFCERCGSFLRKTSDGLVCPRCGLAASDTEIEVRTTREQLVDPVIVVEDVVDAPTVSQTCPECGHTEAHRVVRTSQGEHAGVKQDRVLVSYTCTKCRHTWRSS
ncbi:MAG: hypothetical protein JSV27_02575 [Candidatus Bathyarchaeota archaeon]|nr:MAG: hypothetical protein JSV27_02575 [Candidatus Bathyarchaeota archaeon]